MNYGWEMMSLKSHWRSPISWPHHRCQQKAMKIKSLWLTSRSSDYHMQSWRNSRPPSESDWVVATATVGPHQPLWPSKPVYLQRRGGRKWGEKKITIDSDSDVVWSNGMWIWTVRPSVTSMKFRMKGEAPVVKLWGDCNSMTGWATPRRKLIEIHFGPKIGRRTTLREWSKKKKVKLFNQRYRYL